MMQTRTRSMTNAQKVMMRDFTEQMFEMWEKYWVPDDSDMYWDDLAEEAMSLIGRFQTRDAAHNGFLSNIVVAFLNSREELSA